MKNIQESLAILTKKHSYSELVQELLHVIIETGSFNTLARNTILQAHGVRRISDIKSHTLDVIIDYALLCLEDGKLSENEIKNTHLLKLFLGIEEGDFYRNGKKSEIKFILTKQLELVYADKNIDTQEALLMSDLQGLFGLNYMEYEEFIIEIANKA